MIIPLLASGRKIRRWLGGSMVTVALVFSLIAMPACGRSKWHWQTTSYGEVLVCNRTQQTVATVMCVGPVPDRVCTLRRGDGKELGRYPAVEQARQQAEQSADCKQ